MGKEGHSRAQQLAGDPEPFMQRGQPSGFPGILIIVRSELAASIPLLLPAGHMWTTEDAWPPKPRKAGPLPPGSAYPTATRCPNSTTRVSCLPPKFVPSSNSISNACYSFQTAFCL